MTVVDDNPAPQSAQTLGGKDTVHKTKCCWFNTDKHFTFMSETKTYILHIQLDFCTILTNWLNQIPAYKQKLLLINHHGKNRYTACYSLLTTVRKAFGFFWFLLYFTTPRAIHNFSPPLTFAWRQTAAVVTTARRHVFITRTPRRENAGIHPETLCQMNALHYWLSHRCPHIRKVASLRGHNTHLAGNVLTNLGEIIRVMQMHFCGDTK